MTRTFYLHEDSWAMISIIPAENARRVEEVAKEATEFSAAHFDGGGWTVMYMIPDVAEKFPLSAKQIKVAELASLAGTLFPVAEEFQSGYSIYRESLPNCFAFFSSAGSFYGSQKEGIITELNLIYEHRENQDENVNEPMAQILASLGRKYNLMLANWWRHDMIMLNDEQAILAYLNSDLNSEADDD